MSQPFNLVRWDARTRTRTRAHTRTRTLLLPIFLSFRLRSFLHSCCMLTCVSNITYVPMTFISFIQRRHPKTGEYLMFHIGSGPPAPAEASGPPGSGFLHTAPSPEGPWTAGPTSPKNCNNPAPAYHPNGTLFVVCNHLQMATTQSGDFDGEWTGLWSVTSASAPPALIPSFRSNIILHAFTLICMHYFLNDDAADIE